MPACRRAFVFLLIATTLALASCGGGHSQHSRLVKTLSAPSGQRSYQVRLPNGKVVTQAHSPTLAEPPKGLQLPRPASGVATVEQYDSTVIATVPRSAHYVAGYVNGFWPTYFQLRGHWPVVVGISVFTGGGADCFDMEPGNPGPSEAGPWARWQFTQGNARPCEYSMLSWMPAIRANLAAYGIAVCYSASQTHCVRLWDANWTYVRHLDAGYAGTQWTDHAGGLNLDESTMASWFYQVTPPPPPPPPPDPQHYKVLTPTELQVVLRYDGAAQHAKYDAYRKHVLQPELAKLAHAIWVVAHERGHGGFTIRNRGVRFQVTYRRSLGQKVA